jgi:hypothetical protein
MYPAPFAFSFSADELNNAKTGDEAEIAVIKSQNILRRLTYECRIVLLRIGLLGEKNEPVYEN